MKTSLLSCCGDTVFLTIRCTCWVRRGPSLRDLISILAAYPAPRRWAKVARPCGTAVRPARCVASAEGENRLPLYHHPNPQLTQLPLRYRCRSFHH